MHTNTYLKGRRISHTHTHYTHLHTLQKLARPNAGRRPPLASPPSSSSTTAVPAVIVPKCRSSCPSPPQSPEINVVVFLSLSRCPSCHRRRLSSRHCTPAADHR
ncbi:cDNA FLJ78382,hypothetical protein [Striga asiatica]|uniref:Uncharacterized protein n=1 Tax=Striga asiatica TaxID=4170 RepID=A0A5A7P7P7_STRAF|nr:cDNA FLJ78382,hypothetical protein [Striga asiatica]